MEILKIIVEGVLNKKNFLYLTSISFISSLQLIVLNNYSMISNQIIILIILVCIGVFTTELIINIHKIICKKVKWYTYYKNVIQNLKQEEKDRLLLFINNNSQVMKYYGDDSIMHSLISNRIVHKSINNIENEYNNYNFYIKLQYFKLLKKHKSWLE